MASAPRRSLVALALVLALADQPLAAQAFEGTLTARVAGMPVGAMMKTSYSRGRTRVEVITPGRPSVIVITDPAAHKQYMLLPGQQVYTVTDLKAAAARADSIARAAAAKRGEVSLKATGRKGTVAGLSCEHYAYQDAAERLDLCLTTALGRMPGNAMLPGGGALQGQGGEPPAWARALDRKDAFAVSVADTAGRVLFEVTEVSRKPPAPALFAPPAGYRPFRVPGAVPPVRPDGS
jgi:hypothetical protein